jgi:hypothetical protein
VGSSGAHHSGAEGPGALARASHPIDLDDVDRLVRDSAEVVAAPSDDATTMRAWREDLTAVLTILAYAREILAGDITVLHHCLAATGGGGTPAGSDDLIRDLPGLLATVPSPDVGSEPGSPTVVVPPPGEDELAELVARGEILVSAHRHLAQTDLASPASVARALGLLEAQLTSVVERQGAVAARLQEIRVLVLRHHSKAAGRDGSSLDTPA